MLRKLIKRATKIGSWNANEPTASVDLVNQLDRGRATERKSPPPLGVQADFDLMPWSVKRVEGLFKRLQRRPNQKTLWECRHARYCISKFWLCAPVDQLELLYSGELGILQRLILESNLPTEQLASDEIRWRDKLQSRLDSQEQSPTQINLLLALMPYHRPLALTVKNPMATLPLWLQRDYARFCEPDLEAVLSRPVALLKRSGKKINLNLTETESDTSEAVAPHNPPAGLDPLPPIAEYRAEEALELLSRDGFQQRMTGLINLYKLEPGEAEVKTELARLRRQLAQLWIDLSTESLEQVYFSSIGELYRQLLASRFCRDLPSDEDLVLRKQLAKHASDLKRQGAVNVLMAAMMFFPPHKIEIEGHEEEIPAWLLNELKRQRSTADL